MKIKISILILSLIIVSCLSKPKTEINKKQENKEIKDQSINEIDLKNNERKYKVKLFHTETELEYDTIVSTQFLEDDLLTFLQFNYPRLENKITEEKSIELFSSNLSVSIEIAEFEKEIRNLKFDTGGNFLKKIDGKEIYGTDGNIPRKEISHFYLTVNGKTIEVPKDNYNDLFEPNIKCLNDNDDLYCYTEGYLTENDELILTMQNSDGAGGYMVIFFFDKEYNLSDRIIGYQF